MKIDSDFKDYYDIGISYGIDPKCVYKRKEKELSEEDIKTFSILPYVLRPLDSSRRNKNYFTLRDKKDNQVFFDKNVILFCGEIYTFLTAPYMFSKNETKYLHTYKAFQDFCNEHEIKESGKKYYQYYADDNMNKIQRFYEKKYDKPSTSRYLEDVVMPSKDKLIEIHRKLNTPIIDVINCVSNPCLRNFGFASQVDPYTAFQEINMFITNVFGVGEPDTIEIDEKYKIEKHGFDKKTSFRHPVK